MLAGVNAQAEVPANASREPDLAGLRQSHQVTPADVPARAQDVGDGAARFRRPNHGSAFLHGASLRDGHYTHAQLRLKLNGRAGFRSTVTRSVRASARASLTRRVGVLQLLARRYRNGVGPCGRLRGNVERPHRLSNPRDTNGPRQSILRQRGR